MLNMIPAHERLKDMYMYARQGGLKLVFLLKKSAYLTENALLLELRRSS